MPLKRRMKQRRKQKGKDGKRRKMFEEIVRALHICTNDEEGCEDCPFYMSRRVDGLSCYDQLKREAANAIEALKEQLQAKDIDIDGLEAVNDDLQKKKAKMVEEIMKAQKYRFSEQDEEIFISRRLVLEILQKDGGEL